MRSLPQTGLLGGAFDPPHIGHLALAQCAIDKLGLKRLIVLTTGQAPHKEIATPAETRLQLAQAAFGVLPEAECSRYEIDKTGPSFTVDTLAWARECYGEVAFIIGSDEFASFPSWRDPAGVLSLATLAVGSRPGYAREELEAIAAELLVDVPQAQIVFFDTPMLPTASRDLRQKISAGEDLSHLVPQPVADLIAAEHLYC